MRGKRRPTPPRRPQARLPAGPPAPERPPSAHRGPSVEDQAAYCLGTADCCSCDLCRLLCPDLAITRDPTTGDIQIDLDYCKGCGICSAMCPKGAIAMVVEDAGS
jgi:Pyruvate/2-oxoacid:ferredoxin oxidoreductase delta subunit